MTTRPFKTATYLKVLFWEAIARHNLVTKRRSDVGAPEMAISANTKDVRMVLFVAWDSRLRSIPTLTPPEVDRRTL